MASTTSAACCAIVALLFWAAVGYPIARRLAPPSLAGAFAPLAGWALHSVVALPAFFFVPFTRLGVAAVAAAVLAASWVLARRGVPSDSDLDERSVDGATLRVSRWAWTAAALLAALCATAILPKHVGDAVFLSDQIFDHAKVSMVDEMARLGVPPRNPFFADDGGLGRLSYYYLLHFADAELSLLLGVDGWEADIATTFFAVFTSLSVMMGLAVRYSGRTTASIWVVALAVTSTSRSVWLWLVGAPALDSLLPEPGGLGGWFFQSSWVPQHLISTNCVLLSMMVLATMAKRPGPLPVVVAASLVAAAFESSTWVGGIVFALSSLVVVPLLVVKAGRSRRTALVVALAAMAVLTLLLVLPLLRDQIAASAGRRNGLPIVFHVYDTLGDAVPAAVRTLLDGPAYWLLFLPILLPATYVAGMIVMIGSAFGRGPAAARTLAVRALAVATAMGLAVSCFLVSTFADNNDLGWRAALLAAGGLIVLAAIGLSTWVAERRWVAVGPAIFALAIGLPESWLQAGRNLDGHPRPEGRVFARAPELWSHVRAYSAPDERIASNPLGLEKMTPWPVNIGWSLLADRRSCYAGWELTQVFTAVPHDELRKIDAQFVRVFRGEASPAEVEELATVYRCRVAVITVDDGAWSNDPFRDSPFYRLVDETDAFRIYRAGP